MDKEVCFRSRCLNDLHALPCPQISTAQYNKKGQPNNQLISKTTQGQGWIIIECIQLCT